MTYLKVIQPNNVLLFDLKMSILLHSHKFILTLLLLIGWASLAPNLEAQIFRDNRDADPNAVPRVIDPETGEPVMEGEAVETEGSEDPEAGDPDSEGAALVASPVAPPTEVQEEMALNRERDAEKNVSSPGVAALLMQAGQLRGLAPATQKSTPPTVIRVNSDPLMSGPNTGPGSTQKTKNSSEDSSGSGDPLNDKLESKLMTQPDARTFTFSIPAPRGQILDRNGYPLAQTKVVNYAAIEFPQWGDDADEGRVQQFAAERIVHVNRILGTQWDLAPKVVRQHYKNRRWMPLLFSSALTKKESEKLNAYQVEGLRLHPVYLRHYPNEKLLSHVIGYVGKRPPRATGPISSEEPLWGAAIGAQGLELSYDEQLTGVPGKINVLYDGKGNKIREDNIAVPRPGLNVVTTLDIEMQRIVEKLLRERTKRGAMVVMNVNNGDVVAMASYPQFNPNDFIPSISTEKYKTLLEDPEKPLFPRAFQGSYPPASTFKVSSALAFLDSGHIYTGDVFPCPSSWQVGDLVMKNWNSSTEGDMNVVSAIARSCNTWFYEVAIEAGADSMSSMALRLGLGEKTGIPLPEDKGFIPTNRYWLQHYGYQLTDGDEANMSIGQGRVKTTPIQIARMMAAIGNRQHVFKPRMVRQLQDVNHNVIEVFPPQVRNTLSVRSSALSAVRKGMYDVVNASFGTGKAGWHEVTVAAKTGTGQWITQENRNIAWFAGYFPVNYPIYSFAMVYEGEPGEKVSGGKNAAPIVSKFLNEYLNTENLEAVKAASKQLRGDYTTTYVDEIDTSESTSASSIFRNASGRSSSSPAAPSTQAPKPRAQPVSKPTPRRTSIFNRLFNKRGRGRR